VIVPLSDDRDHTIDRIVEVLAARGYTIDRAAARVLWQNYSDSMAAGWMQLPDDDEVLLWLVLTNGEVVDEPEPETEV